MIPGSDPFDYDHVPLCDAGTICVRYLFVGKIEPRPYEIEEDVDAWVAVQEANEDPSPSSGDAGG